MRRDKRDIETLYCLSADDYIQRRPVRDDANPALNGIWLGFYL